MKTARKQPFQPEHNYLLRRVADPQLSPDGRRVSYTLAWNDRDSNERQTAIYVTPIDGAQPAYRFSQGTKDHSARWSPDGRFLAFISDRGKKGQLYLAPLDGGEPRQLTTATHGVADPAWSPDSSRIAYSARTGEYKEPDERDASEKAAPRVINNLRYKLDGIGYFDERRMHIFTIDAVTGDEKQITDGDWFDQQPSWSPDGKTICFSSDREPERHDRQFRADIWAVPAAGGRARRLTRARGWAYFPSFSPDSQTVAFVGHEHGDEASGKNQHVFLMPAAGGSPRSISAPLDRTTATFPPGRSYAWLPKGDGMLFLALDRGSQALFRTGTGNGSLSKVLGGDRQIGHFNLSHDGRKVAFSAQWSSSPPEVYVTTLGANGRERNISHANDELLARAQLGKTQRTVYRAADRLEIEAFVIYPPGYIRGQRYPLVLDIHGGPHGQHPQVGFNPRPQALAASGYVVLLPNPRGSQGYGQAFSQACIKDWGGKDYEDLMAGVDALIERGIADPERLFVTGYSYGGFMTTWVIGHTDRFKAAIIGAPVAHQVSMRGTSDIPRFSDFEIGGTPFDNLDEWRMRSPLTYLPNVQTPVMIEHHEGDLRCPIGQGEEIFQNLKLLGRDVEFVRYPGGFHTIETHLPSQDVDYMQRSIGWFNQHLPRRRASLSKARTTGIRKRSREKVRAGAAD